MSLFQRYGTKTSQMDRKFSCEEKSEKDSVYNMKVHPTSGKESSAMEETDEKIIKVLTKIIENKSTTVETAPLALFINNSMKIILPVVVVCSISIYIVVLYFY